MPPAEIPHGRSRAGAQGVSPRRGDRRSLPGACAARALRSIASCSQERIAKLNRKKIRFIDDELYHGERRGGGVDADRIAGTALRSKSVGRRLRVPRDLPPYLQDLYRTPLLTPGRERALFLKFNFHKYQFVQARRDLDPAVRPQPRSANARRVSRQSDAKPRTRSSRRTCVWSSASPASTCGRACRSWN